MHFEFGRMVLEVDSGLGEVEGGVFIMCSDECSPLEKRKDNHLGCFWAVVV